MDLAEGVAAAPPGTDKFDDQAGSSPKLPNGVCGAASSEYPAQPGAMSSFKSADLHCEVLIAAILGDDLLIEAPLVVFDCKKQVGAILGGEWKKRG